MQYYKATVRLGGSTMNEVVKILSAPEVLILQFVHGVDAITKIEESKKDNINLEDEKDRLRSLYNPALARREQSVDTIFGPLGQVVEQLPDKMLEKFGIVNEDDVFAVIKQSTTVDKSGTKNVTLSERDRLNYVVPTEEIDFDDIAG